MGGSHPGSPRETSSGAVRQSGTSSGLWPEWGAPKPPMTPEALIVHYADDLDAKLQMVVCSIKEESNGGPMTSKRNAMNQQFYRGDSDS